MFTGGGGAVGEGVVAGAAGDSVPAVEAWVADEPARRVDPLGATSGLEEGGEVG